MKPLLREKRTFLERTPKGPEREAGTGRRGRGDGPRLGLWAGYLEDEWTLASPHLELRAGVRDPALGRLAFPAMYQPRLCAQGDKSDNHLAAGDLRVCLGDRSDPRNI